jgi:putative redox protein
MATAKVLVEQISGSTSRGNARGHELLMDRPEAKGGSNAGMMGGEAVLNGLGGCFLSNLLAAAKARNIELSNARADIEGDMADETVKVFTSKNTCFFGIIISIT